MNEASEMFQDAIRSLCDTYDDRPYFVERTYRYTVQLHLWKMARVPRARLVDIQRLPYAPRSSRQPKCDLAIRSGSGEVLLAAEFKYEPAHRRLDLLLHKFPVIGWGD